MGGPLGISCSKHRGAMLAVKKNLVVSWEILMHDEEQREKDRWAEIT